ncbi:MAG TPA: hypothetical protein VF952_01180 [Chloroflexia bacterium]|jgi:hypothetical protein
MRRSHMPAWVLIAILFTLLAASIDPILAGAAKQHSASSTPTIIEISPDFGGPGTVVQVRGIAGDLEVSLFLAVLGTPQAITGSRSPDLNGPIIPLGSPEGRGEDGTFSATVTIPATWWAGRPITETDLCIIAGEQGHLNDSKPFTFAPSALPTTGKGSGTGWLIVVLLAVSCTAVGGLVLRKANIVHGSSRQY